MDMDATTLEHWVSEDLLKPEVEDILRGDGERLPGHGAFCLEGCAPVVEVAGKS